MIKYSFYTLITFYCLSVNGRSYAQTVDFPTVGIIEFEKTVNMYSQIKKNIDVDGNSGNKRLFEEYKFTNPQFLTLESILLFSNNRTLFTPKEGNNPPKSNIFSTLVPVSKQNNIIYTDYESASRVSQKTVFEEIFLVKDSVGKITWRVTNELREIAGFSCRRANGIILDSIYVVAFYTEQIPVSGGPESFSGLPGMILGIALPYENTTWFAKTVKIDEKIAKTKDIHPPANGKSVSRKEFISKLNLALNDWGRQANQLLKSFLL